MLKLALPVAELVVSVWPLLRTSTPLFAASRACVAVVLLFRPGAAGLVFDAAEVLDKTGLGGPALSSSKS